MNKNIDIQEFLKQIDRKEFKEEVLKDELFTSLQNYSLDNCLEDFHQKFSNENILKEDFEKYLKSRLRFFIMVAYILGKVKN